VRRFDRRLRELCGFGTYQALIGHIEKHTPAALLLDGDGAEVGADETNLFDRG
jgi:hypothetical protein